MKSKRKAKGVSLEEWRRMIREGWHPDKIIKVFQKKGIGEQAWHEIAKEFMQWSHEREVKRN